MSSRGKVLLGVVLARCPHSSAGHTCAIMNWVLAFQQEGWEVWLTEHLERSEMTWAGEDRSGPCEQEIFWRATMEEFGLTDCQCLLLEGQSPDLASMRDFAAVADWFLNYSGQFRRLDLIPDRVKKLYLDVDPAFTQIWAEECGCDMNFAGHDRFLTVGTNINGPEAFLPKVGLEWVTTATPAVADYWARRASGLAGSEGEAAWTTIGHWYGYDDLQWNGKIIGGKRESFLAMRPLAEQCGQSFAIATDLERDWGDFEEFVASGWKLLPAREACRDVDSYLRFIAGSRGEIGIAKAGYLVSHCGWVSDRSMVYLSLGKPVLLQDTGWPLALPGRTSSMGLRPFTDVRSAAEAIAQVEQNYQAEAEAAGEIARTTFSPATILDGIANRL